MHCLSWYDRYKTRNTAGGIVAEGEEQSHIKAAVEMVDLFASVGVERFELTHTNLDQELRGCRNGQTATGLKHSLPYLIPSSFRRLNNVILRPHNSKQSAYIQLDDLDAGKLERVKAAAFMVIETSPGNFQAWLAVKGAGKNEARRLRKGTGADPSASGATRVAGSANHKRKYAPKFPIVRVTQAQAGRITTVHELDALGLLAPADPPRPAPALSWSARAGKWPSYAKCLAHAPLAGNASREEGNRKDISKADFTYALIALDWGRTENSTVDRLMKLSDKAQENGLAYAQMTVRNAAAAIAERAPRSTSRQNQGYIPTMPSAIKTKGP
jgi:hypothetical protein